MPSTVIRRFSYDEHRRVLHVEFQSGVPYDYFDVPPKVEHELRESRSKGIYFNQFIKPYYRFQRLAA
ncbi:MAG: KTSC domain-containing protein [Alphaproteobacteria bacterium]|nr:KTSC domain-containing protein [Alphaproteobacteria bacterium]